METSHHHEGNGFLTLSAFEDVVIIVMITALKKKKLKFAREIFFKTAGTLVARPT
jgi:hypothetical protein